MNNAPTKGYEEDVGRMTMIRVVSHTSVPLLLKNPDYFFKEANATIYVIWGPFRNMRKDGNGIVYNMLKKTVDIYPNAQIYVTTEKRMSYCDGVFKKETGKDRWVPWEVAFLSFMLSLQNSLPAIKWTVIFQTGCYMFLTIMITWWASSEAPFSPPTPTSLSSFWLDWTPPPMQKQTNKQTNTDCFPKISLGLFLFSSICYWLNWI